MSDLDAAIDDYLHRIVRTRPWTKKREEALLNRVSNWLHQHADGDVALTRKALVLAREYAAEPGLPAAEAAALREALERFSSWAIQQGLLTSSGTEGTLPV